MAGVIAIDDPFFVDPHDLDPKQVPALPMLDGRWHVALTPRGEADVLLTLPAAGGEWSVPPLDDGRVEADLRWESARSDLDPHWSFRADGQDRWPTGPVRPELNLEAGSGLPDFIGARVYCASNFCQQRSLKSRRAPPLVARIVHVVFPLAGIRDSGEFDPPELLLVVTHESQAPRPAAADGSDRGRIALARLREPLVARLAPTEIICKRCHRSGWVRQRSADRGVFGNGVDTPG